MSTEYTTTNNTVYNIVTDQILAQLESGVVSRSEETRADSQPGPLL